MDPVRRQIMPWFLSTPRLSASPLFALLGVIVIASSLIQSAMRTPSGKSVQVAQMKCVGCLEETQRLLRKEWGNPVRLKDQLGLSSQNPLLLAQGCHM